VITTAKVPFDHFVESQIITLSKVLDHFVENHFVENMIKSQKLIQNTFDKVIYQNVIKGMNTTRKVLMQIKTYIRGILKTLKCSFMSLFVFKTQIKADHVPHDKVFVECLKHRSKFNNRIKIKITSEI
jgi:hypothetical protein